MSFLLIFFRGRYCDGAYNYIYSFSISVSSWSRIRWGSTTGGVCSQQRQGRWHKSICSQFWPNLHLEGFSCQVDRRQKVWNGLKEGFGLSKLPISTEPLGALGQQLRNITTEIWPRYSHKASSGAMLAQMLPYTGQWCVHQSNTISVKLQKWGLGWGLIWGGGNQRTTLWQVYAFTFLHYGIYLISNRLET